MYIYIYIYIYILLDWTCRLKSAGNLSRPARLLDAKMTQPRHLHSQPFGYPDRQTGQTLAETINSTMT